MTSIMANTTFDSLINGKNSIEQIYHSITDDHSSKKKPRDSMLTIRQKINSIIQQRITAESDNALRNAGFIRTNDDTTIRCAECQYEITNWKTDRDLLTIHTTDRPNCPFICKVKSSTQLTTSSHSPTSSGQSLGICKDIPTLDNNESPPKRRKIEANDPKFPLNNLLEATALQQIRKRTFSHWPHKHIPSQAQMVEAGFFNCNVGDRVICIYCNLICQQWTPETDNPTEVHKTLSPNCVYVKTKLLRRDEGPLLIVNENGTVTASANGSATSTSADQFRCNEFVHTAACNAAFAELPKRAASFVTWPTDNLPSVDDLVRAGFFFTGIKTVVTCFYCNGSLQNWGPNDNPTIEHARWFPHCAYARQLCGDELYRKIQESKRAQQERAKANETRDRAGPMNTTSSNSASNSRLLFIPDESTLSRLVAARLDLPISQTLLGEFKLSIIKRCWEDQLRLKHDDFVSDSDLRMACTILQKQISCIDGKKENIVVPCIKMRKLREEAEKERADAKAREQLAMNPVVPVPAPSIVPIASDDTNVEMTTPEQTTTKNATPQANIISKQDETNVPKSVTSDTNQQKEKEDIPLANACVLCMTEEKRLACMPCGHFVTCVPCGHSLRCCPICRREIEAFVRIFV